MEGAARRRGSLGHGKGAQGEGCRAGTQGRRKGEGAMQRRCKAGVARVDDWTELKHGFEEDEGSGVRL